MILHRDGPHAATDVRRGFVHRHRVACGVQRARGGQSGQSATDDAHVHAFTPWPVRAHAAIHVQHLTGQVVRRAIKQPCHRRGHLFGLADPADGHHGLGRRTGSL